MTIKVELPRSIETNFIAKARAKGVTLDQFVRDYLIEHAPAVEPEELSAEELDAAFEELADMLPVGRSPLSDEAVSRESIYSREDGLY